jgi:hypothetical protein
MRTERAVPSGSHSPQPCLGGRHSAAPQSVGGLAGFAAVALYIVYAVTGHGAAVGPDGQFVTVIPYQEDDALVLAKLRNVAAMTPTSAD